MLARPFQTLAQHRLPARAIPGGGEALPVIGLGSTKPVLDIPTEGTGPLVSVLRMLAGYGGSVVDTAPRPEQIDAAFGRVLNAVDLREQLFIATKITTSGAQAGIAQMRQTQRLFGRRTMDLVQIENLIDLDTQWRNLREWKDTGEARYIGVTVSDYDLYDRLEAFMTAQAPDFVHVNYSIMERRAEERLLPLARDRGMAVLTNRPFMNGNYFRRVGGLELPRWAAEFDCASWAQFSLKYILAHPAVTCALAETTNPRHMQDNVGAGFGRLPDETMKQRMRTLVERL